MENQNKHPDVKKALEILFSSEYLNKRRLYWHNFVRGIVFGAGSVLGATILIGLILWVLSILDTVPFVGPFIDNLRQTIEKR